MSRRVPREPSTRERVMNDCVNEFVCAKRREHREKTREQVVAATNGYITVNGQLSTDGTTWSTRHALKPQRTTTAGRIAATTWDLPLGDRVLPALTHRCIIHHHRTSNSSNMLALVSQLQQQVLPPSVPAPTHP
jgi:hypothetical protein